MTCSEMNEAWDLTPRRQRTEGYNLIFLRGVEFVYVKDSDEWVRRDVHDREREQREQQAQQSNYTTTYTAYTTATSFFNITSN